MRRRGMCVPVSGSTPGTGTRARRNSRANGVDWHENSLGPYDAGLDRGLPERGYSCQPFRRAGLLSETKAHFRSPAIGENRLDATGRRIAGTVRHLYNEAALSGLEHRLAVDLEKNTVGGRRLERDGELVVATGSGRDHTLSSSVDIVDISIPGQDKITSGQVSSRIFPVGWMEETVIHLKSDKRSLTLHLQPLTGVTDIYEGYREFN